MNTSQLECCIQCDPVLKESIIGVFSVDRLPECNSRYQCGFIANTDIHIGSGKHWCAFYFDKNGKAEFFDSYGKKPSYYNSYFPTWLSEYSQGFVYNSKQIQNETSNMCGFYSLHYLQQRLTGHSMEDIVGYFSSKIFFINDYFIFDYMSHIFSHCIQTDHLYNQICIPLIKF